MIPFGKTIKELLKVYFVNFLIVILGFLANILIARLFGVNNLGIYSYFFSLVSLLSVFGLFGLHDAIAKLIAEKKELSKYLFWKSFIIALPLTLFSSWIILLVLSKYIPKIPTDSFKWWVLTYIFVNCIYYLGLGVLRGFKKFTTASLFSLYPRALFIPFILLAWQVGRFDWLVLGGMSWSLLILYPLLFDKIKLVGSEKIKSNFLINTSLVLWMTNLGMLALIHLDKLIIGSLVSWSELGQYTAYSNTVNLLRLGAFVLPVVLVPMAVTNKYKIKESFKKLILFLIPSGLIMGGLSFWIVPFLFGSETKDVNILLPWLMVLSSCLMVIYSYFSSLYVGEGKSNNRQLIVVIFDFVLSILFNIGLTFYLVKYLGLIGAPLALFVVLIFKTVLNIYFLIDLRKKCGKIKNK